MKRLIPEKPYIPVAGMNPDANGLSLRSEEAVLLQNLRPTLDGLRVREGTKRLGLAPDGNPILHMHTYKGANEGQVVFCFTKDLIYKYNPSTDVWFYATGGGLLSDIGDDTNITCGTSHIPMGDVTLYKFSGTHSYGAMLGPLTNGSKIFTGVFTTVKDASSATQLRFKLKLYRAILGVVYTPVAINLSIKFYKTYSGGVFSDQLGSTVNVTTTATQDWQTLTFTMPNPGDFDAIKGFEILVDGDQIFTGEQWAAYLDYLVAVTPLPYDVTFWDTTEFVDDSKNHIIVAAGSIPVKPDEAESDGNKRALWHYQPSTGLFEPLTIYENLTVENEDTTKTLPAATFASQSVSDSTIPGAMATEDTIVEGLFSIFTLEDGTLATASTQLTSNIDGSGNAGYYLIPTASSFIVEASSYVLTDGKWKITFAAAAPDTILTLSAALRIAYTYRHVLYEKPRYVKTIANRLVFGNIYWDSGTGQTAYYPWLVRWSTPGDASDFPTLSYQELLDTGPSVIYAMVPQGYYLIIYTDRAKYRVNHVGGTLTFEFTVVENAGIYAGRTVQSLNEFHYFLGLDDIYVWNGAISRSITRDQQTGGSRVRTEIFDLINYNQINHVFGSINEKWQEYWLWIVKIGETYPSTAYVYSALVNIWYVFTFSISVPCIGYFRIDDADAINQLVGTIQEQTWTFGGAELEGIARSPVLSSSAGDIYALTSALGSDSGYYNVEGTWVTGALISWWMVTRDFLWGDLTRADRCNRVEVEIAGSSLTIAISGEYTTNISEFKQSSTKTLTPGIKKVNYFPDIVAKHLRLSLVGSGGVVIRWIQPYAVVNEITNE